MDLTNTLVQLRWLLLLILALLHSTNLRQLGELWLGRLAVIPWLLVVLAGVEAVDLLQVEMVVKECVLLLRV